MSGDSLSVQNNLALCEYMPSQKGGGWMGGTPRWVLFPWRQPLCFVCRCLEYLLRNDANPGIRDNQGYNAVHYASAYGHRLCLELVNLSSWWHKTVKITQHYALCWFLNTRLLLLISPTDCKWNTFRCGEWNLFFSSFVYNCFGGFSSLFSHCADILSDKKSKKKKTTLKSISHVSKGSVYFWF